MREAVLLETQKHHYGVGFSGIGTIILSVAATAGVHGYIEQGTEAHGIRGPISEVHHLDHLAAGTPEILDKGTPQVRIIKTPSTGDPTLKHDIRLEFADSAYARQFDADPAVAETDKQASSQLADIVSQLKGEGWTNISLRLTGKASAEDDSPATDSGITAPSVKNQQLADARRDRFAAQLKNSGAIPADINLELLPGAEGTLSADQIHTLEQLVSQFGFSNVANMIDDWNLGKPIPPAVESALEAWLKVDRGVSVEVVATKIIPGETTVTEQPQRVCVVPVREVEQRFETTKPWKATLPWIIPVPFVYPFRRRHVQYVEQSWVYDEDFPHPYLSTQSSVPKRQVSSAQSTRSSSSKDYVLPKSSLGSGAGTENGADTETDPTAQNLPPATDEPTSPSDITDTPLAVDGEPSKPAEEITPPKEKGRRKWPWIIPIGILIAGASITVKACQDDKPKAAPSATPTTIRPKPVDPCEGLPTVTTIVDKKVVKIVNGRVEPS